MHWYAVLKLKWVGVGVIQSWTQHPHHSVPSIPSPKLNLIGGGGCVPCKDACSSVLQAENFP